MTKYEVVNTHGDYTVEVDGLIVATAKDKDDAIKIKKRLEKEEFHPGDHFTKFDTEF